MENLNTQHSVIRRLPESATIPNSVGLNFISNGNNVLVDESSYQSYMSIQVPVNDNFISSEHERAEADPESMNKKRCPLEMSIKAADLDMEFAKDTYTITNGVITRHSSSLDSQVICNGVDGPKVSLPPFTSMMRSTGPGGFADSSVSSAYSPQLLPSVEPLTLTLQPGACTVLPSVPVNQEPLQVVLVAVQPQIPNSNVLPQQSVVVSTSPLVLSTSLPTFQHSGISSHSIVPAAFDASNLVQTSIDGSNLVQTSIVHEGNHTMMDSTSFECEPSLDLSSPQQHCVPAESPENKEFTTADDGSLSHHTQMMHDMPSDAELFNDDANTESLICEVEESDDSMTDVDDEEILREESLVLKIRKVPQKSKPFKRSFNWDEALAKSKEKWVPVKPNTNKKEKSEKPPQRCSGEAGWSASDDETLAKAVKKEDEENNAKTFKRAPKCCARRCHSKIQPANQEIALNMFQELEERGKGDCYLANCILIPKPKKASDKPDIGTGTGSTLASAGTGSTLASAVTSFEVEDPTFVDIAYESNGNKSISDEIQNAINESLKDQEASNVVENTSIAEVASSKPEKIPWQYVLVINGRQRLCCIKFLLALLKIPISRLEAIQMKIENGEPIDRMPVVQRHKKEQGVWLLVKKHLDSLPTTPVPVCPAKPPHRQLLEKMSRLTLFESFVQFYKKEAGKDVIIKYDTYRRFVHFNSNLSFPRQDEEMCARCEGIEGQAPHRGGNGIRSRTSNKLPDSETDEVPLAYRPLKRRRKRVSLTPSENSSCENPDGCNRNNNKKSKPKVPKNPEKRRSKSKKTLPKRGQRGDVFSLMLSHLKTLPCRIPQGCQAAGGHKFFSPEAVSIQALYEDYRKYFLKRTNSELGLRFAIYESLLKRNPCYTIADLDTSSVECPKCSEISAIVPANHSKQEPPTQSVKR